MEGAIDNKWLAQLGLELKRDEHGLSLGDGTMWIRGDFSRMAGRLRAGNLHKELLVRAAKVKGLADDADGVTSQGAPGSATPTLIDATAGLGEDSFLLAAAGFSVTLYERNPVIAALLADALARAAADPALAQAAARMQLVEGDSTWALRDVREFPDVVLLDPMFPTKQKNSAAKKKLQLLHRLEEPCDDERALFDAALAAQPRKIVVKRPVKGPSLAGRKPDYSLCGKAVRYDCYAFARPRTGSA